MSKVWIESAERAGALHEQSESHISVFDHGFTVGDGVFETIKTVEGRAFALSEHLERLASSARMLKIAEPDLTLVRSAIRIVCQQEEVKSAAVGRLRVTWTSGVGALGSDRGQSWTLVVAWALATPWPSTANLASSSVKRNQHSQLSGAKTTSYAENALAIAEAKSAGASEALLLNLDGMVCEGGSSNIFAVKDGVLLTPPPSDGCLVGVTRNIVLRLAKEVVPVLEKSFTLKDLFDADEVFITSSTRDIQPVAQVDNQEYSVDRPITSRLMKLFSERAEEYFND